MPGFIAAKIYWDNDDDTDDEGEDEDQDLFFLKPHPRVIYHPTEDDDDDDDDDDKGQGMASLQPLATPQSIMVHQLLPFLQNKKFICEKKNKKTLLIQKCACSLDFFTSNNL